MIIRKDIMIVIKYNVIKKSNKSRVLSRGASQQYEYTITVRKAKLELQMPLHLSFTTYSSCIEISINRIGLKRITQIAYGSNFHKGVRKR